MSRRFLRSALLALAVVVYLGAINAPSFVAEADRRPAWISEACAQGVPFGPSMTHQASKQATAFDPATATGVQVYWDAGTQSFTDGYGAKGSYLLATASSQYFEGTTGDPPLCPSGTPSYPLTWCGWVRFTNFTQNNTAFTISLPGSKYLKVWTNTSGVPKCTAFSGGSGADASASALSTGTWYRIVARWVSDSDRWIHTSADTTGGENTGTKAPTGLTTVRVGFDNTAYSSVEVGPQWLFSGDWSDATSRNKFLTNGCDPESAACLNTTATARWLFDNAATDSRGTYDLTATNSPTAQNKILALYNRVTANPTYNALATTSAPTYSSSYFGGTGGADFASQHLNCYSTPVNAAPLQVYAGAEADDFGDSFPAIFSVGKSVAAGSNYFALFMELAVANTPSWRAMNSTAGDVDLATTLSSATPYLFWGFEESSSSRKIEVDGANQGTNATSKTPSGVDAMTLGGVLNGSTTPSFLLDGKVRFVVLLNTSSTAQQADFEAWSTTEIGAP